MAQFLDETFEEEQSRERIEHFYGQYSADVRKRLLSKNVKRPENLYDALYTPVRNDLLSKNVPSQANIDDASKDIRNRLLSKQIESDINLDESGENIRKSLLAKNDLIKSSLELENIAQSTRKSLLSKNTENENANPEVGSNAVRNNLESKNVPSQNDLDESATDIRRSLLSKNESSKNTIDKTASQQRQDLLSKNVQENNNIDQVSGSVRQELLSKNVSNQNDLDKSSAVSRKDLLSKNNDNHNTIDDTANQARQDLLASNAEKQSTLDGESAVFRHNLESKNKPVESTLDATSEASRIDLLSKNKPAQSTIDSTAGVSREDLLSKNVANNNNIDKASQAFRDDLLSANVPIPNNIDAVSETSRKDLQSANKPSGANPEIVAKETRDSLLSANKPNNSNLDGQSQDFRDGLLSNNVPNGANPENGASATRDKLLSGNVPNGANPEMGAEDARGDLVASNVPSGANPEIGADDARNDLLASNVPNGANPETGSGDFRDNLLSHNVPSGANPEIGADDARNDLLASNVPNGANPEIGADDARNDLLASNVPNGANPEIGADDIRDELLAHNQPTNTSLDIISGPIRDELLSSNVPNGNNVDAIAVPSRNDLLSKNVPKNTNLDDISNPFRHQLISKNGSDTPLGANIILPNGTSQFVGISNLDALGEITRQVNKLKDKILHGESLAKLQRFYGTEVNPDGFTPTASITSAAQLHNIENNTFALHRYAQNGTNGLVALTQHNSDGFQDLITKTIGSLKKYTQVRTNSTPAGVIQANQGQYLQRAPEEILRPIPGELGSASSMMSQTEPSDAIEKNFNRQERGLRHIMNTIKKSNIALAKNYDPQNNKSFIIGSGGENGPKRAFSRFTVANPYAAPKETGVMELRITNYAIRGGGIRTMSFPPYVKSFSHTDDASWNETLFLGRPEPIYTYSNSKRNGTLEFMVLTDYAQSVDIGVDFEQSQTISETFDKHFTDETDKASRKKSLEAQIETEKKKLNALKLKKAQISGNDQDVSGKADLDKQIADEQSAINALQNKLDDINSSPNSGPSRLFVEGSREAGNIYQSILDGTRETDADGIITSHPATTLTKLNEMKEKLLFQPAFFSGDKVDFLRRLEFIAKLTRPARNAASDGFSFTHPPVAHLHLGSWVNHDIIINSVSYSYDDAPWTFDGGRVQPMWVTVTLGFNIVGTYGGIPTENVPLATDTGGFFQRKISS